MTAAFSTLWMFCLARSMGVIKIDTQTAWKLQFWTIALLTSFILLCFSPLHCCYQRARCALGKTIIQILISPFGLVRFRHFFFADILTSMVTPLQMIGIIECFYGGKNQDWRVPANVHLNTECKPAHYYFIAMSFIPYWFRFLQCLNKRKSTG